MKNLIGKLALSSASVLAIGIGCAAIGHAATPGEATNTAKICPPFQASDVPSDADLLRTADIRWAQTELRFRGLYDGPLDGILGPATKGAILRFQKTASLGQTALLDARTWARLTGEPGVGEGSSMPPAAGRDTPAAYAPAASGLGR
ncbi:MAG: peptidoglycan-binding domain-containing protein [Pseudomonadota bacterium]